jgi:hypothetical protein
MKKEILELAWKMAPKGHEQNELDKENQIAHLDNFPVIYFSWKDTGVTVTVDLENMDVLFSCNHKPIKFILSEMSFAYRLKQEMIRNHFKGKPFKLRIEGEQKQIQ